MDFADPKRIVAQLGIVPGMKVADFGSGAGYFAAAIAPLVGENGVVYAIDVQQELLTKARHFAEEKHLSAIVYVHADLESDGGSTLRSCSVDLVLMANVVFQVEDKAKLFAEAFRVLVPGGRLAVVEWRGSFGGVGPQPEHVAQEEDVRVLALRSGFVPHGPLDTGSYHYGFMVEKHGE